MIRNVKALGLAFIVAVAAMGMMAAAAQATQLHANNPDKALLTGEQPQAAKHKFQITSNAAGPNVQCNQAHFEGIVEKAGTQVTVEEITATAQYTACTFLGLNATVTMNGCKYTFTQAVPTAQKTALVDVAGCTAATPRVEVHVPGCTLTIPQQTGLSHATFAQNATHVDVSATVSGITYETHGAACAHQPETVLKHDASYTGSVTLKGYAPGATSQVTHNGHQYIKTEQGAAVSLTVT